MCVDLMWTAGIAAPLIITGLIASANTLFPYASRGHHIGLDKTIMMFSHIGLPIALDLKEIIYDQDLVHDFKLSTEPDIFSQENPDFSKVKKVGAHLDSHFAYERNFFMKLSVLQPYAQRSLGAGINKRCVVSLPIKMDFKLDLETEKFTLKWTPIPHHIVHTHYEPFTFIESHSDLKPLIHETTYIPMPSYQLEKINKDFGHDAFGLGIRVEADYLHDGNTVGDWYNFFMENDFRDRYYYYLLRPEFRPYHVDLYLTGANRDLTNEVELELGFDYIQPGSAENFAPKFDAGFEEEGRARGDLRWETLVLRALLTGRGQRERKVNAEISVSQSTDQIHHKWNIFYDRTPFSSKESDHFKLCLSSYLKYPKYDISKFFLLDTASQDNNMNAIIKTNFGRDCSTDSKVMIQGHLERTNYQKKLEAEREVPLTPHYYNVYGLNYQKCQKARAKGDMYNDYCRIYVDLASRLHKETWDVKFENIHDLLYNLSYRASDAFKHYYYPYAQVNHLAQNEAGHVKFLVEHHVHHTNRAHMTIYKPHETVRYDHIPFHYFIPVSPSPINDHSEIGDDVANPKYPYCVIYGDHVHTFDNYTYDLPEIGCYKVLAKDCSPLQEFLILGAKVAGNDRFSKAFKAFFGGHKLEGLPTADGLILRLDGSRLAVPDNEPLIQLKPDGSELFHVHYNGLFYSIISELYGLKIYYDGNGVCIRPDFFYRGKLCGLCGDYNGDRQMELRGPDGCVYNNTATFSYSYAIPDDTCNVPKVHGACDTWRKSSYIT
ncbi:vit-6 [Cordylochernes scorpioides]|uniref:Vit-6 n=1 Tax=Cordylochernes scorpioides TaxID=51811 RepID=A0ABY6LEX4_9ARAC|nr:vit-6 [Cordylochernes scorpioides]